MKKMKLGNIIFWLWICVIIINFVFQACNAERYVKMHVGFGAEDLILAVLTFTVIICVYFFKKIGTHWFFIPLMYAFSGVILGMIYSSIPCCTGG